MDNRMPADEALRVIDALTAEAHQVESQLIQRILLQTALEITTAVTQHLQGRRSEAA